jgi:acyl-CoA synthetase (AMP-forming)/AMP-acid ligase II
MRGCFDAPSSRSDSPRWVVGLDGSVMADDDRSMASAPRTVRGLIEAADGAAPALADGDGRSLSYRELRAQVEMLGEQLGACGVGPGDRVATILPNGPGMAVAFLAATSVGAAAPLNPAYRAEELRFYFGDLKPKVLITTPETGVAAREVLPDETTLLDLTGDLGSYALMRDGEAVERASIGTAPEAEDHALLLHTSGTTARPKLVPLTQGNVAASAANIAEWLRLAPGDRCLNVMPLFHIHGLMAAVLASVAGGAALVATPGFDAFRFFEWVDAHEPSWYTAVPTMHQLILSRAGQHEDVIARRPLRFIRSSSAGLPPSVFAELERVFGAPVVEAYGMTEASHQMSSNPLDGERRPGTVGVPAGADLRILDEAGDEVPSGGLGEVAIRGAGVTAGYVENPEANAAAFAGEWFRTGDQGSMSEDGYLTLTGRLKELINRGGEKVAPLEVDDVLLQHPAVAQAVTFARPHERLGEDVAAAVVLVEGADVEPSELRAFAAERLAAFKVPRTILCVDEIPKGPTGKLQRIGLAERLGLE